MPSEHDLITAQEAARIYREHNPILTPREQAQREVDTLIRGYLLAAARKGTFLDLNLDRVDLTAEIALEFNRLGFGVTYELLDGVPNGKMRVRWPEAPWAHTKVPPVPPPPPRTVETFTPWHVRLRRRLGLA
ncbi:hypothetical protein [Deinococcus xianganensis]|uniref:Uncharacterized protein n=1 Tax=Deinococcus xianganensis TaxID=1507289 RepID=A0A6I4YEI4_9DEIO|nr:hypothetical protein [Deinococcus xianganensis]MXV20779.1 hypothetical protein [Deinococcus xianganensis]